MVFKCKHILAPTYLQDLITFEHNKSLRYTTKNDIPIIKFNTTLVYKSSFKSAGPRLWNKLPKKIKAIDTLSYFKTNLKTHLFHSSYNISTLTLKLFLIYYPLTLKTMTNITM